MIINIINNKIYNLIEKRIKILKLGGYKYFTNFNIQ